MGLIEFFNAISFDRMKKTEREDRLKEAARVALRNKTPWGYISAQLDEVIRAM